MNIYNKEMHSELSQISASIGHAKDNYLVHQAFQNEFYLHPDDLYKKKKYNLHMNVSDNVGDWIIQDDSTILKKNLSLSINFSLKEIKTNKVITSGSGKSLFVFTESPSAWSAYVSSEKAYENALNDAMRSVRIQVSLFLAKQHNKSKNENKPKKH